MVASSAVPSDSPGGGRQFQRGRPWQRFACPFREKLVPLLQPYYLLYFRHIRTSRGLNTSAQGRPRARTKFPQIAFGALMRDQSDAGGSPGLPTWTKMGPGLATRLASRRIYMYLCPDSHVLESLNTLCKHTRLFRLEFSNASTSCDRQQHPPGGASVRHISSRPAPIHRGAFL